MGRERHQGEDAYQDRVPVEDAHGITRGEVGEEREREPALAVERHPAQEVAEGRPEEHGQESARRGKHEVPRGTPERVRHVAPKLDGDAAADQAPENEDDREVEARDARGEHPREGHEERASRRE